MTVRELMELLNKMNPDAIIVLSGDAEGNAFLLASGDYSIGKYDPKVCEFWDEDEPAAAGQSAIVLWPEHYAPTND